ncbi:MAG: 30S ribosomal protein S6 [bacterium TMED46]|nr:MAG: 30S ribosomal protein S6 [bacterium TMED46]
MRFYETLYIVDSNLENKVLEKAMADIGNELNKTNAKIINHRLWGKKRLAYAIDRQKYGSYIILQFKGGDLDKMPDFDVWMRLNNSVLRHMTVALKKEPDVYVEEEKPVPIEKNTESKDLQKVDDSKSESESESGDNVESEVKNSEDESTDQQTDPEEAS